MRSLPPALVEPADRALAALIGSGGMRDDEVARHLAEAALALARLALAVAEIVDELRDCGETLPGSVGRTAADGVAGFAAIARALGEAVEGVRLLQHAAIAPSADDDLWARIVTFAAQVRAAVAELRDHDARFEPVRVAIRAVTDVIFAQIASDPTIAAEVADPRAGHEPGAWPDADVAVAWLARAPAPDGFRKRTLPPSPSRADGTLAATYRDLLIVYALEPLRVIRILRISGPWDRAD